LSHAMDNIRFLFDVLPARVFNPFSLDGTRRAYEVLLRVCIQGPFSKESVDPVEKPELQGLVERTLSELEAENPGVECPAPSAAMRMMFTAGWLTEHRDGWKTVVEMDRSVAILAEFLCRQLPAEVQGISFGDGIASLDAMLQSAHAEPDTHAGAILEAARSARSFAANVRAIAGNLRSIERSILSKPNINEVVSAFFDEFVAKIHAGDYAQLTSSRNHPYHFRSKVIRLAEDLSDMETLRRFAEAMATNSGRKDVDANCQALQDALDTIIASMDAVERSRQRIDASKANVERRFLNTIRQVDLTDPNRDRRFNAVSDALKALRGVEDDGREFPELGLKLIPQVAYLSPGGFRDPPRPRERVLPKPSRIEKPDPMLVAYQKAAKQFMTSLLFDGRQAARKLAQLNGGIFRSTDFTPRTSQEIALLHSIATLPLGPSQELNLGNGYVLRRIASTARHGPLEIPSFEVVSGEARRNTEEQEREAVHADAP